MQKLYDDFGDIHRVTFKEWWTQRLANGLQRGMVLFAESALPVPRLPATLEEVRDYEDQIASGDVICVLLPGGQTYSDTLKLGKRILSNHHDIHGRKTSSTVRYKLSKVTKNSVQSLLDGLRAFDMRKEGFKYWQIGAILKDDAYRRAEDARYVRTKGKQGERYKPYDVSRFSAGDFFDKNGRQLELERSADEPYPPDYNTCHSHGERVCRLALINIRAAEEAEPSEGLQGWGTFPSKL
ncbi:hypothetical protein Q6D67_13465 [Haliea sp. E1-2-M8]|uniref:hypothetical protein n=1 Tax=Haliea sp. E1-2-M8 TaxID=3064706 RepID=UPI0027279CDB|nr:hypothetical protein [Haliea sp. E1-2-M8]MDO8862713.1 hypothetical protein [Haliea sp. E1-2-M8]